MSNGTSIKNWTGDDVDDTCSRGKSPVFTAFDWKDLVLEPGHSIIEK